MTSQTPGGTGTPASNSQGGSVLEHLDPATLLIETNVRADLGLTPDFIASIKTHGVLQPVLAVRTPEGVRVRAGQRRTAAAVEAGRVTIPVMILDDDGDATTRIIEQLTENVHRAALTDSDTVAAVEQLALLGCTAASIAKRTRIPRPRVDQALLVSDSSARDVIGTSDGLTLEHAAWLAEFEDDPEVYEDLRQSFLDRPDQARHAVERERRHRRELDAKVALAVTIAAQNPGAALFEGSVYSTQSAHYLNDLVATPGDKQPISVDDHQDCPGHAFQLRPASPWNDHPALVHDGIGFDLLWLCTDWKTHGHHDRYKATPHADSGKPEAGTDEAKEQRRATIALNKAGEAAKTVREEWLTRFTIDGRSGKHLPVTAHMFMLTALDDTYVCSGEKHGGLPHVQRLLGINLDSATVADKSAAHILLCARLWEFERLASREIWRQTASHRHYLEYLESWGYTLSDVEKCGAGHITTQDAYQALQEQP